MKTVFYILLLTFLGIRTFAKTNLYPGLVKLIIGTHISYGTPGDPSSNISDTVVFKFYQSPQDTTIARQLSFYFDWSRIPRKERVVEQDYHSWLSPLSYIDDTLDDFDDIYFTCKSQKGNWFEVVVNEKTQKTLWIKNKRFVRFLSWNKLYKKEHISIVPKTKIYNSPDTSTVPINYAGTDCFEILKVRGNWMQISNKNLALCGNDSKPILDKVWINYKSDDKLFFDIKIW